MEWKIGDKIKILDGPDSDNHKHAGRIAKITYIASTHASVEFEDGTSDGGIELAGCLLLPIQPPQELDAIIDAIIEQVIKELTGSP